MEQTLKSSQKHGFEGNNLSTSSGSVKLFTAIREQGRRTGKEESIAGATGMECALHNGN